MIGPVRVRSWCTVALLALAVACACFAGTAEAAGAPTRIMPLGDSITDGYNIPGGYRIALEDSLAAGGYATDFVGSRVNGPSALADRDHEGHSGWRIAQIAGSVDPWVTRTQPEIVLLLIGTNDMLKNNEVSSAPQRLGLLIDRIAGRVPSATILVGTMPPSSRPGAQQRIDAYNAALPRVVSDRVAQGREINLVDQIATLTLADLADGVHPNARGYSKISAAWHQALTRVLAVPSLVGAVTPHSPATPTSGSAPPSGSAPAAGLAPALARSTVSIGGLSGSSATGARRWTATATARVRDQDDAGVAGATVSFALSGAATGARTCTTAANGSCAVRVSLGHRAGGQEFEVTGITAATGRYEPGRNATSAVNVRPLATLARLRSRRAGLGARVRLTGPGRVVSSVRLSAPDARRLRLRGPLAAARRSYPSAGSHELLLRFSRRTRAKLARNAGATLVVGIRTVDTAGGRHLITRRVKLRAAVRRRGRGRGPMGLGPPAARPSRAAT